MSSSEVLRKLRQGFLFSLERRMRQTLGRRQMTDDLKQRFAENGIHLVEPKIKPLAKGREWVIVDGDKEFNLLQEGEDINVYDISQTLSQPALARMAKCSRWTINTIETDKMALTKGLADRIVTALFLSGRRADMLLLEVAKERMAKLKEKYKNDVRNLVREFTDSPVSVKHISNETWEA